MVCPPSCQLSWRIILDTAMTNLLQIIRGLIARNSELLCLLYFQETTTSRPHPKNPDVFIESPAFRMNQTGFNILAMKLSGKRAERYQIRFAQAFEAAVKALQNINLSTYQKALRLEAKFDERKRQISFCASSLAKWKDEKKVMLLKMDEYQKTFRCLFLSIQSLSKFRTK